MFERRLRRIPDMEIYFPYGDWSMSNELSEEDYLSTIDSGTLKGAAKATLRKGKEGPPELANCDLCSYSPFPEAWIRKWMQQVTKHESAINLPQCDYALGAGEPLEHKFFIGGLSFEGGGKGEATNGFEMDTTLVERVSSGKAKEYFLPVSNMLSMGTSTELGKFTSVPLNPQRTDCYLRVTGKNKKLNDSSSYKVKFRLNEDGGAVLDSDQLEIGAPATNPNSKIVEFFWPMMPPDGRCLAREDTLDESQMFSNFYVMSEAFQLPIKEQDYYATRTYEYRTYGMSAALSPKGTKAAPPRRTTARTVQVRGEGEMAPLDEVKKKSKKILIISLSAAGAAILIAVIVVLIVLLK